MFDDVSVAVLAGGLGTRLRSVVADRPKVLAPVAGRPFLAHLLDQLAQADVREVTLLVGHGAEQVRAAFGERHAGTRLSYSVEPAPLGTAGAVRLALPQLREKTILLLNGDSYCDLDLQAFLRSHRERKAPISLALTQVENASRFGRVQMGEDDRVMRFEEKNPHPAAGWINAGIYLLRRDVIAELPADQPVSLERDVLLAWVARGGVRGFRTDGRFIDIGIPESYAAAEAFFAGLDTREAVPIGSIALRHTETMHAVRRIVPTAWKEPP